MKSMTGFGRSSNRTLSKAGATAAPLAELDISIKAVNGRYLDLRFHLPREYAPFESNLKSQLTKIFSRGTVDVYVNRSRSSQAMDVQVNSQLAQKWLESYRALSQTLGVQLQPGLESFTRIPEIFQIQDRAEVSSEEQTLLKNLLEEAAQSCDSERQREGQALNKELSSLCAQLEALSVQMLTLKSEAVAELEKRLRDRLEEQLKKLGFAGKFDDQRLAQEIVLSVDRTDISEELQRLKEHINAYRGLLASGEPQGKKLDFYAQELLREVNTIGSKSHIAKLTSLVVEAKTLVEKIREQVQNVE